MGTGFQDWDVPVNINSQTLGEVINRPKYGGALLSSTIYSFTGVETKSLIAVTGRGMLYGGYLLSDCTQSHTADRFQFNIDGSEVQDHSYVNLFTNRLNRPSAMPWYHSKYDRINFSYGAHLTYGFTFETSFEFIYEAKLPGTALVYIYIFYATI